jgi:hypothetical protein
MKRLKKIAQNFKYTAVSELKARARGVEESNYDDELYGLDLVDVKSEINEAIGDTELAQYIDPREGIYDVITSIKPKVSIVGKELMATTEIITSEELDVQDIEDLKDYLLGQYADGWGEGFEQNPVTTFEDGYDYEYEEEDEYGDVRTIYETEQINVELLVSFWHSGLKIDIKEG